MTTPHDARKSRVSLIGRLSPLRQFRQNLQRWYEKNARDLPWRRTRDPYRIWISEIMLQQTTVAAVIPYFNRFLQRFPNVKVLADATEEEVLRYWEGLGYYSRARNIHKTARLTVADNQGTFPEDVELLLKLPGIGRYTAGAIASFAFDRTAPILEANTLRLYCRLLGYDGDPRSTAGQRLLWDFAGRLLPRKEPGRFNQALMELGGTVCSAAQPNCRVCPVRSFCAAFDDGLQDEIPRPASRPEITETVEAAAAICSGDRYLLLRRPEHERWGGLWDFPRYSIDVDPKLVVGKKGKQPVAGLRKISRLLEQSVLQSTGLQVETGELLATIRHAVTRYRITLLCLAARLHSGVVDADPSSARWVSPGEFGDLPLSVTGRKLARILAAHSPVVDPARSD